MVFLASNVFFGQSVFDKFEGQDDVASIVVNKKMFQMMGSVKVDANDKETQQYLNLIRKLDNLKVFSTANNKVSDEMKSAADKYWKIAGLEELTRLDNGNKSLKIWAKSGANSNLIKELLVYNAGVNKENQTVLMSLTGDFTLNEIAVLIDKMKIPGGVELKRATKGN